MNILLELKQLYQDYMNNKQFNISHYRRLSKIVRESQNNDSDISKDLQRVWRSSDRGKYCLDSQRVRFVGVLGYIANLYF